MLVPNRAVCTAVCLHLAARRTLAHSTAHSAGVESAPWWLQWTFPPLVMAGLSTLALLFCIGWYKLHSRRSASASHTATARRRMQFFLASLTVLVLALSSPIDAFSEQLGWVHMIQHILLILVAAPLFVLAASSQALLWSLPKRARIVAAQLSYRFSLRRLPYYPLSLPLLSWLLFGLTLWTWHLPLLYGAALRHPLVHDLQHLAFFGTATLFWHTLLHPLAKRRLNPVAGVLYIFLASLHSMLLGVAMWLSPFIWYREYASTAPNYGISAMHDQQLAGYLMWMPACTLYGAIAVALLLWWLRADAVGQPQSPIHVPR